MKAENNNKRADDTSALNSVEQRVMGILNGAADKVDAGYSLVAEQGWRAGLRLACRTAYHLDREDGDDMSTGQPVGIFDQVSQSVINMEDEPNDLKIGTKKRSRSNRAKPGMKKKRSSSRPKPREDIDELDEILGPTKPIDDASKSTDQKLSAEPEVSTSSQPPVQKSEILGPKPIDDTSKLTDQKLSAEPEVVTPQHPVQKIKNGKIVSLGETVVMSDRENASDDLEIATPAIDIDDKDKKVNEPKSESFMKRVRRDLSTKANLISSIRSESTQVKRKHQIHNCRIRQRYTNN